MVALCSLTIRQAPTRSSIDALPLPLRTATTARCARGRRVARPSTRACAMTYAPAPVILTSSRWPSRSSPIHRNALASPPKLVQLQRGGKTCAQGVDPNTGAVPHFFSSTTSQWLSRSRSGIAKRADPSKDAKHALNGKRAFGGHDWEKHSIHINPSDMLHGRARGLRLRSSD